MIKSELKTTYLPFPEKDDRKIWIYIPEHNEGDRLPVIYMTDGQNLFDENSTPHGSWDVISAVENEMKQSGKSAVIVGIDNGNEYRDSELTPKCIGEIQLRHLLNDIFTPQGEIFDYFLMNTVIPYVEENFPVKTDKRNVAVCGSSSGGLQSFFAGIEHPDKFSFVGAFSPAFLCYTENDWRAYLMQKVGNQMPYLYIYTGNGDELEGKIFESVEMMYDLLPETGYPYDMMNEVILFENEHNEKAWKGIFPDFLHTFLNNNNFCW
ncbi:MAG: alpha/beta hydrolase-fold protein [Ruminococcus sp.]|nr:alpha/beta hydrolase-fold protein [Ruminococcus sp.]